MKLNLLLSLGIVVNTAVGETLPSKSLPPKIPITNTVSSSNVLPTSTKVIIPSKSECGIADILSDEQINCEEERDGYFIFGAPIMEDGSCPYRYACFLPSGAKKIFPDAFKAQDPSECIKIKDRYYCSADLNNFSCENCTYPQFVQMVYETFGEKFHYENIDVTKITTPIELPTDTPGKIKCAKGVNFINEGDKCESRGGQFIKMSLYPDCDKDYYACFLPNNKKVTKNAVVAQKLSECVKINGNEYCSVDYTNISCPDGKECTFTELIQEISNTFGDYFSYEKSSTTSTEAVSIPKNEFCNVGNYQYYKEETNCEKRDGIIVYNAPVNDDGNCEYKYACFLPSGVSRLFPDAFKAEDSSECIHIYGHNLSRHEVVYCSADVGNIECPNCTFPQYAEKVKEVLDNEFNYEAIDVSKITKPVVLPKDITPQNIECTKRKPLPEGPYNDCRMLNGKFLNMEFYPDCETTYYSCFIPQDKEPEEGAIKAKDISECITIGKFNIVYCAADYYSGVTCPEGKDNCTFTEYVQEMYRIFGDYFDYKPYITKKTDNVPNNDIEDPTTDDVTDGAEDYSDTVTDSAEIAVTAITIPSLTITTTTTKTIPNCIPVTVTEKVKEVITETVKETVTVTVESA